MKCQGLRKLIPDYLAGELPQEVLREFEAHLMQCDDCRAELEQMELTWVALGDLPEDEYTRVVLNVSGVQGILKSSGEEVEIKLPSFGANPISTMAGWPLRKVR